MPWAPKRHRPYGQGPTPREAAAAARPDATQRGYGAKWRKLSKAWRRDHPLCAKCGRPGQVVDHIQPHRGDPALFWDRDNLQTLCKPCHDKKTGKGLEVNQDERREA